jgi:mannose-6-phosphate isomerase-like protein (cupin superfamily)
VNFRSVLSVSSYHGYGSSVSSNRDVSSFGRVNLFTLPLGPGSNHGGQGAVQSALVATRDQYSAACHFIYYMEVPPGCSVGDHAHELDSEEIYVILSGSGQMRLDDEIIDVESGDVVRNAPGGTHGLVNTGTETIRFFAINAEARSS